MTDNDIIKALEDALAMGDSPIGEQWGVLLSKQKVKNTLDLINRQKAEIEALKLINSTYVATTNEIREIAIKEFAERLCKTICMLNAQELSGSGKEYDDIYFHTQHLGWVQGSTTARTEIIALIGNTAKEMVGYRE